MELLVQGGRACSSSESVIRGAAGSDSRARLKSQLNPFSHTWKWSGIPSIEGLVQRPEICVCNCHRIDNLCQRGKLAAINVPVVEEIQAGMRTCRQERVLGNSKTPVRLTSTRSVNFEAASIETGML